MIDFNIGNSDEPYRPYLHWRVHCIFCVVTVTMKSKQWKLKLRRYQKLISNMHLPLKYNFLQHCPQLFGWTCSTQLKFIHLLNSDLFYRHAEPWPCDVVASALIGWKNRPSHFTFQQNDWALKPWNPCHP